MLNTGVTVWDVEGGTITLIFQTTIQNPSGSGKNSAVLPYKRLYHGMKAILGEFMPQVVFSEKMFASRSGVISEMLFNASLMVRMAADDLNITHRFVPITGVTGWQNFHLQGDKVEPAAKKKYVRRRIESNVGVEFSNEHCADAAAIGFSGWYHYSGTDYRAVLGLPTEMTNANHLEEKPPRKAARRTKRKAR